MGRVANRVRGAAAAVGRRRGRRSSRSRDGHVDLRLRPLHDPRAGDGRHADEAVVSQIVFEELVRQWGGEEVVVRHARASGTWIFVCVHSTCLGPGMGGTRMKRYGSPSEALEDGLRLASGMTRKLAVAGLPC